MKTLQEMTVAILLTPDYSEASLALAVGTTQPTINRIKKGKTKAPGYDIGRGIESIYLSIVNKSAA